MHGDLNAEYQDLSFHTTSGANSLHHTVRCHTSGAPFALVVWHHHCKPWSFANFSFKSIISVVNAYWSRRTKYKLSGDWKWLDALPCLPQNPPIYTYINWPPRDSAKHRHWFYIARKNGSQSFFRSFWGANSELELLIWPPYLHLNRRSNGEYCAGKGTYDSGGYLPISESLVCLLLSKRRVFFVQLCDCHCQLFERLSGFTKRWVL